MAENFRHDDHLDQSFLTNRKSYAMQDDRSPDDMATSFELTLRVLLLIINHVQLAWFEITNT